MAALWLLLGLNGGGGQGQKATRLEVYEPTWVHRHNPSAAASLHDRTTVEGEGEGEGPTLWASFESYGPSFGK